ncbi:hypothetical protein AWY96_20740 [Serratia plymuthica]|uniref:hypothetical protein n=1 Tax=Serratia plymuthica TaxID=82996 RepID=UPI0007A0C5A3|nr:hypothetical protein [Serratia plymuthica]KYQ95789.1 hypothetical protein AWY96_20740 [Serratia plymuthica]
MIKLNKFVLRGAWVLLSFSVVGCGLNSKKNLYNDYAALPVDGSTVGNYAELRNILIGEGSYENAQGKVVNIPELIPKRCFGDNVDDRCRYKRNEAIYALVIGSEQACLQHRKTIYGNDALFNVSAGSFTNLFAGIATVATPTTTKSVFSALALFSNAERSLVNEVVYKQMIVPAVDKKIMSIRAEKVTAMANRLKNESINDYGIDNALSDFINFHNSCSFMEGLRLALDEGVNDPKPGKINALNSRLLTLSAQIMMTCAKGKENDFQCNALKGRYESVSDALKVLETQ